MQDFPYAQKTKTVAQFNLIGAIIFSLKYGSSYGDILR